MDSVIKLMVMGILTVVIYGGYQHLVNDVDIKDIDDVFALQIGGLSEEAAERYVDAKLKDMDVYERYSSIDCFDDARYGMSCSVHDITTKNASLQKLTLFGIVDLGLASEKLAGFGDIAAGVSLENIEIAAGPYEMPPYLALFVNTEKANSGFYEMRMNASLQVGSGASDWGLLALDFEGVAESQSAVRRLMTRFEKSTSQADFLKLAEAIKLKRVSGRVEGTDIFAQLARDGMFPASVFDGPTSDSGVISSGGDFTLSLTPRSGDLPSLADALDEAPRLGTSDIVSLDLARLR